MIGVSAWCQDLYLDAMVTKDSVILRWAPTTMDVFENGVSNGYVLEKIVWRGDSYVVVDTIRPASVANAEMITRNHAQDDAALVAAYYLHGDKRSNNQDFSSIVQGFENHSDKQLNFNLALAAADLSVHAANILGLRYVVPNTSADKKSIYRLRSLGAGVQDTASYWFTGELSYFPVIDHLDFLQTGTVLQVKWDNLTYQNYYTAYDLYRSSSVSGKYAKVNKSPIFQGDAEALEVIFKDSVEIGKVYSYKVQGRNAFGGKGALSSVFNYKVLNMTVPYRAVGLKARGNHEAIEVEWLPDVRDGAAIKTVKLLKSNNIEGPYEEIGKGRMSTTSKKFSDDAIEGERVHYYRVAAENKDGYWYHSNPVRAVYEDVLPPAVPAELIGVVDSTGVCYIHWKPNAESDLKGYRVYKSNRSDGTFYHAHDLLNYTNTFIDTVGVDYLTEKLFYKVVAVDYDNNHSDYSSLLTVSRPDLVSPVPAQIYKYEMVDQGLKIFIHSSPSKDVAHSYLIMSSSDDSTTMELEIDKDQRFYIDQSYVPGVAANYQIKTVDDAENIAFSRPLPVRSHGNESLLQSVSAIYKKGNIEVSWITSLELRGDVLLYLQAQDSELFEFISKVPMEDNGSTLQWSLVGDYKVAVVLISEEGKRYPPVFSNKITIE